MFESIFSVLSHARQKKELLVLLKSKEWVYVGTGNPYDTIWLDVDNRRYIVCVSLTTVRITLLDRSTGKFCYNYSVSPKSLFLSRLDMRLFIKVHQKTKKALKHAKETSMVQEKIVAV